MTLQEIALLIPAEYRKEILLMNMIGKAQAVASDPNMFYLFTIWKNYVEKTEDLKLECNTCLSRVLNNYSQLVPALIELEKTNRMLKTL